MIGLLISPMGFSRLLAVPPCGAGTFNCAGLGAETPLSLQHSVFTGVRTVVLFVCDGVCVSPSLCVRYLFFVFLLRSSKHFQTIELLCRVKTVIFLVCYEAVVQVTSTNTVYHV